jgi:GLPGLI family protein
MKLQVFIFLSLLSTITCLAQNTSKLLKDTTTLRVYYVFSKKEKSADQFARVDTMLLDIGKSFSRFYDPARLKRDSAISNIINATDPGTIKEVNVLKDDETNGMSDMAGTVSSNAMEGESYQIIKSKRGEITVFDYGASVLTKVQYDDFLGKPNWQLQEGTDTVEGYECQKAILNFRGRNYTAWFTLEIPISDGPWKLFGLPGLILKVEDADQLFSFVMIGLVQPKQIMPYQVAKSEYLKISREDYRKQVLKRGGGMKVNLTNGIMTVGTVPSKSKPALMEME